MALYVGYYASQRQGDTIHSPQNCLPGAGWRPVMAERSTIDLGGRTIPVNRFIIQKGMDRQAVLYWYQGRSRVVASELANKAWLMLDAARLRRTDGGLVRLITPVSSNPADAFAALDDVLVRPVSVISPLDCHENQQIRCAAGLRAGACRHGGRRRRVLESRDQGTQVRGERGCLLREAAVQRSGDRIPASAGGGAERRRGALQAGPGVSGQRRSAECLHRICARRRPRPRQRRRADARGHHPAARSRVRSGADPRRARTEGRPESCSRAHPARQRQGRLERDRGSDAADPGGHRSRPLVRAGVDGARRGHVHWRPQSRSGGGIQEGGRARATVDRSQARARQLRVGDQRLRQRRTHAEVRPRDRCTECRRAPRPRPPLHHDRTASRRPSRISARSRSTPPGGWRSPTTTWGSGGTPMR